MEHLAGTGFKLSVVITRENVGPARRVQGDRRPLRRAAAPHPAAAVGPRRRRLGHAAPDAGAAARRLRLAPAHGENVLTGDSFFHLAAYGQSLPGLNLCGAGRVVCLIDPVGDVYACPFAIHETFLAGNVRASGGFAHVWRHSELFPELREPQSGGACSSCGMYDACRGGCMAAKFFTGLPLDGPDPECVLGHGETALRGGAARKSTVDHSTPRGARWCRSRSSTRPCNESPGVDGLVRERRGGRAAGRRGPAPTRVFKAIRAGTERGLTLRTTSRRSRSWGSRRTSRAARRPRAGDDRHGRGARAAGAPLPGRRPGRAPSPSRARAAAAARGTAFGLSALASTGIEEVVAANPKTFAQTLLGGLAGGDRGARRAGARGGRGGADRHAGLDVLAQPRLGLAVHPTAARPQGDGEARTGGAAAAAVAVPLGADRPPAGARGPELRRLAGVLRRLRRVDGHAAAVVGGHRLAALALGRAVHGQGDRPGRRRPPRGRGRRRDRALGLQPRRQQPRRHAGHDPRAVRGGRGRRTATPKCCWTAASAAAATSSRRSRWAPAR